MKSIARPVNKHDFYHAHLYFDEETLVQAIEILQRVPLSFDVPIGAIHQEAVGPHPKWSCQITFSRENFSTLIPWLEENRQGLTVLVHGLTGNNLDDHTAHTYWLGNSVELNLSIFGG